jgi:hypothetical protein
LHKRRHDIRRKDWHLREHHPLLVLEPGGEVTLAKEPLGPLFLERDPGGALALHTQNEAVAEVVAKLHRHHPILWALGIEDQEDAGGVGPMTIAMLLANTLAAAKARARAR